MKKLALLLVSVIMALTLTACDGDKTTTKAENATTSENSTTGGNGTSTGGENGTTNSTTTPSTTEPTTPPATAPFSITINDIKDFYGNKLRFSKVHLIDAQGAILKTQVLDNFKVSNQDQWKTSHKFENLEAGRKYGVCLQTVDITKFDEAKDTFLGEYCDYYYNSIEPTRAKNIQLFNDNASIGFKLPKKFTFIVNVYNKNDEKQNLTKNEIIQFAYIDDKNPNSPVLMENYGMQINVKNGVLYAQKPVKNKNIVIFAEYQDKVAVYKSDKENYILEINKNVVGEPAYYSSLVTYFKDKGIAIDNLESINFKLLD